MSPSYCYVLLILCAVFATGHGQTIHERNGIINGTLLNSLKQFPHQVGIHNSDGTYCSGSIIAPNWVITAETCVGYSRSETLTLMFKRLDVNVSLPLVDNAFTIQVNGRDTHLYGHHNLALVKLPMDLKYDSELAPVALAIDPKQDLTNAYAVMPGIKQFTTMESYGQFEILSNADCGFKNTTICTLGWENSSTVPCAGTQGGGLLLNWPTAPQLVGVFSAPQSCLSYIQSEYAQVSSAIDWIENVIQKRIKNDGYF